MGLVNIARFRNVKGRWIIVEGDPNDHGWTHYLGAQKLMPGNRLHEMYRRFSADEITDLRQKEIDVIGPMGEPVAENWEGYIPQVVLNFDLTPVART